MHAGIEAVDALRWDALLAAQRAPTVFMRHAYLCALETCGSVAPSTGWQPVVLTLEQGGALVGACPLYLKAHSWGEYVFDWAWADAYRRHGLAYYPKLLGAVPFTPVPGSRLLAADEAARGALLDAIAAIADERRLSSTHLLFVDEGDREAAARAGWMLRSGVQFHWIDSADEPFGDFEGYLARLHRDKRKKIRQERRRVADAGVHLTVDTGEDIDEDSWDHFHRCYALTYRLHHSQPYLPRDFWSRTAHAGVPWVLFTAWREGRRIAASLLAADRARSVAYGRYWGALEPVDCLHFEACYYRPIEWCLAEGIRRFEGGAQGEHKMARGLLPVTTWSAHRLAHPRFADAVRDYLAREGAEVESYLAELQRRDPFRDPARGAGMPA